jgi:hypothetical protein
MAPGDEAAASETFEVAVETPLGMSFAGNGTEGFFVTKCKPGSNAAQNGRIEVGLKIVAVCGTLITADTTKSDIAKIIKASDGKVKLQLMHPAASGGAAPPPPPARMPAAVPVPDSATDGGGPEDLYSNDEYNPQSDRTSYASSVAEQPMYAEVTEDGVMSGGPEDLYANEGEYAPTTASSPTPPSAKAAKLTSADVGRRCTVAGFEGEGTIRFVGPSHVDGKRKVGVELDAPVGKNSGSWKGHEYFSCASKHGVIGPPKKVTLIDGGGTDDTDGTNGTDGGGADKNEGTDGTDGTDKTDDAVKTSFASEGEGVDVTVAMPMGMSFEGDGARGFYVKACKPGGNAAKSDQITPGLRIAGVAGSAIGPDMTKKDVVKIIKASSDAGQITLQLKDDAAGFAAFQADKYAASAPPSPMPSAPPSPPPGRASPPATAAAAGDEVSTMGRLACMKLLRQRGVDYSAVKSDVDAIRELVRSTADDGGGDVDGPPPPPPPSASEHADLVRKPSISSQDIDWEAAKGRSSFDRGGVAAASVSIPKGEDGYGLVLSGPADADEAAANPGITIKKVKKEGPAAAMKFLVGCTLLTVNGKDVTTLTKKKANGLIKRSESPVEIGYAPHAGDTGGAGSGGGEEPAYGTTSAFGRGGGGDGGGGGGGGEESTNPFVGGHEPSKYEGMGRLKLIKECKNRGLDYKDIAKDVEALKAMLSSSD